MLLFHFADENYGLKDIRERRVKIARIDKLNDPFEFLGADLSDPERRNVLKRTKSELAKERGLLCFSKSWNNPVLWSHYANNHKGICMGFDIPGSLPRQVTYVNSRFNWPTKVDEDFTRQLLFTKFVHWSYEDEYRVYTTLERSEDGICYADFGDKLRLKKVIVGSESEITRNQIADALGELSTQVEVFKARAAFKSFRIVRNKDPSLWR